jgi:ABC-type molybdate transport system substrate-binding protein
MMKKIIIILFGVLLFTSCLKEEIPFQYTIRVYVAEGQHNPIEADIITLKYLKTGRADYPFIYNDAEKYYEFAGLIDSGEYQIWVQKNGNIYKPNQNNVTLNEKKINSVNMKLEKY